MATRTEIQDRSDSLAQDRKALQLRTAEHVAKVDREYPEANLLTKGDWWKPSTDFGFDVKGRLPAGTPEKLNACFQRMIDQKYAPEAVNSSLDEARGYLVEDEDEDLLERLDKLFGNRGLWNAMYKNELDKEKTIEAKNDNEPAGGTGSN